jgi:hypothetical protein
MLQPPAYEFTPEHNPLRRFDRLGAFRYEVPLPRTAAVARLRAHTIEFDPLAVGQGRGGVRSWLRGDRLRVWKSTVWRRQPGRGALVLDAHVEDHEDSTVFAGTLHLAPAFVLSFTWIFLAVVLMVVSRFPPELIALVLVVGVGQYMVLAVAAHRDADWLLQFVDVALQGGEPAPI